MRLRCKKDVGIFFKKGCFYSEDRAYAFKRKNDMHYFKVIQTPASWRGCPDWEYNEIFCKLPVSINSNIIII